MPSKAYEDMLAQMSGDDDAGSDDEPVGRRPSVKMEEPAPDVPVRRVAAKVKEEAPASQVKEAVSEGIKAAASPKMGSNRFASMPEKEDEYAGSAKTGREMSESMRKRMPSAEQKRGNEERLGKVLNVAATALPVGAVARGAYNVGKAANAARSAGNAAREALRESRGITQGPKNMGYKSGGSVSSASSRADGIAQRGKTRGKVC